MWWAVDVVSWVLSFYFGRFWLLVSRQGRVCAVCVIVLDDVWVVPATFLRFFGVQLRRGLDFVWLSNMFLLLLKLVIRRYRLNLGWTSSCSFWLNIVRLSIHFFFPFWCFVFPRYRIMSFVPLLALLPLIRMLVVYASVLQSLPFVFAFGLDRRDVVFLLLLLIHRLWKTVCQIEQILWNANCLQQLNLSVFYVIL